MIRPRISESQARERVVRHQRVLPQEREFWRVIPGSLDRLGRTN